MCFDFDICKISSVQATGTIYLWIEFGLDKTKGDLQLQDPLTHSLISQRFCHLHSPVPTSDIHMYYAPRSPVTNVGYGCQHWL